jgi:drug/metabolite transporter (DMT)-like permease
MLLVLGEGLLAVMAAMIKHLSDHLDTEVIVFARNLFGLLILIPIIASRGGFGQLRTRFLHLHMIRGFTGVTAMFCFFYTIGHIALAEAVLVKMTVPFFLPIVAWLWLREVISLRTWLAIIGGFAGVAMIMDVSSGSVNPVWPRSASGAWPYRSRHNGSSSISPCSRPCFPPCPCPGPAPCPPAPIICGCSPSAW